MKSQLKLVTPLEEQLNLKSKEPTLRQVLQPYLAKSADVNWDDPELPSCSIRDPSPGLEANSQYFDHKAWAKSYFDGCHRDAGFRTRWQAAAGSWDRKIVIDIGCGPGNVYATVGGAPQLLIGVDVSRGALEMARDIGYRPILADAHALPFVSGFADIVVINASLHHCDDMNRVLAEAARLVAPGGLLVTDHDPQLSAWDFRGPAKWAWNSRLFVYRWLKKGFHGTIEEQSLGLQSEIHHMPGKGVTQELYDNVLIPMGFEVETFFHNNQVGASALLGDMGPARAKYRIAQAISGLDPDSKQAALSIMCRATKVR
jgi:SAM-dependent methyltransferase